MNEAELILDLVNNIAGDALPASPDRQLPKQFTFFYQGDSSDKLFVQMQSFAKCDNQLKNKYDLIFIKDFMALNDLINHSFNHTKIYYIGNKPISPLIEKGIVPVEIKQIGKDKHQIFRVPRRFTQPKWVGGRVNRLLVWTSCGQGDVFYKWRCINRAKKLANEIIFEARPSLMRFVESQGVKGVLKGSELPDFDQQIEVFDMEYPNVIWKSEPVPYVYPDDKNAFTVEQNSIGIVWKGSHVKLGKKRHINPKLISELRDFKICSIQKHSDEFEALPEGITDLSSMVNDWKDTMNLFANLRLLLTVDTGAAHLAGAMGIPVWLLHFPGHYIHYSNRDYPTMRIIEKDWNTIKPWLTLKEQLKEFVSA